MEENKKEKIRIICLTIFGLCFWTIMIFGIVQCCRHGDDIIKSIGKDVKSIQKEFNKGYNDTLKHNP